ncbi:MAG: carcinine hydrolase/isopenicillin-N N-acyltransferase family protein [Bacteroidota bacterium]
MWYGWNDFAQGGINSAGLFFDVAVTPEQKMPEGYDWTDGNIGDNILANASTVKEALEWMEKNKFAVHQSHFLIGDALGNAVIVEWVDGKQHIIEMESDYLIATNYLLTKPEAGNYPCRRYESIEDRVQSMIAKGGPKAFPGISNLTDGAMQPPRKLEDGKVLGTLYTSFFDITNMKMVFLPKLDNSKVIQIDLREEFESNSTRKIDLFK